MIANCGGRTGPIRHCDGATKSGRSIDVLRERYLRPVLVMGCQVKRLRKRVDLLRKRLT